MKFVLLQSDQTSTCVLLMKHESCHGLTEISRSMYGKIKIPANYHLFDEDMEIEIRNHNPNVVGEFGEWVGKVIKAGY